jgi:aspartyl-tRNA(Asn)/glutamyl-tRNA(Gln) amidotransferase subunit A
VSDLCFGTVAELAGRIRARELSAVELVDAVLKRSARVGAALNCFIEVRAEQARRTAAELDAELAAGRWRGPLHGMPISLKDNIAVAGEQMTAGSAPEHAVRPARDAAVVSRLRASGAILFATCNLYEFAYGAPHPLRGPTQNPWRRGWSTGGSSSGSAAAVAAGLGVASIGTDTSGSIRIPAALCGVVGFKPTYGAVSRDGVIPVSMNLDHVGPVTRTVEDCALVLAGCGADLAGASLDAEAGGMTVAVARPQPGDLIEDEVRDAVATVPEAFERIGATVVERALPDVRLARAAAWAITGAEAAEYHHDRLRSTPERYAPGVRTLLETGELLPASAYVRALKVRTRLARELTAALEGVDAVLLPVVPMAGFRIGARELRFGDEREHVLQAKTRYTALAALTGHPAIAIPCGATTSGTPLAVQLIGRRGDDLRLLQVARAFERSTDWGARRPRLSAPSV